MPIPKSLRPKHRASASRQPRHKPCRFCHNLDSRGHANSKHQLESSKAATTSLTLVLDTLSLSNTKSPFEGGCRFCGVLIQALDAFFENWRGYRQTITVDLKEKGSIRVGIDGKKWKGELVEIYAGRASRAPWSTLGTARHIPTDSGSDATFNFIRRCIQACLTNSKHVACKPPSKSASVLPKRLLDVGRVTAPIRLIDTQGRSFDYVTLSHCWGTGSILTATKSNWHQLASNITFTALPPLFQDAILITRQLGLRYIWIDSLCIIQDSARDWETESSKMSGIYENSYVTISATNSAHSATRCLVDRRKPIKITYENTMGKEFAIGARKVADHHPNLKERAPAKPTGPLTSRAWTLQEHVLSTRILHYTATELLFECRTSFRCECLPTEKPYPTTPSLIPKAIAKGTGNVDAVWDAWHRIVEQYSQRELTVATDKLPAISGIASKIRTATESSYIAGLWTKNLGSDLLWSRPSSASPTTMALEAYRAPTFSWASLDTSISYYTPDLDERKTFRSSVTLVSSSVALTGLNALGAVSDASLQLRGPCLSALLSASQRDGAWEYTLVIKGTSAICISHDCLLFEDDGPRDSASTEKTVGRAHSDIPVSNFKAPVLCLNVARYDAWISGLVLGVSKRVSGAYERLGTYAAGGEGFDTAEVIEIVLV